MSEQDSDSGTPDREERTVARLLELAGPARPVPQDVEARVYDSVHAEWKKSAGRPDASRVYTNVHREWQKGPLGFRRRRWGLPLALAAAAALAVVVIRQSPPPPAADVRVGSVVTIVAAGGATALPRVGQAVSAGDRLVTGPGEGMGLMLANAESLRVDENTVLTFDGGNHVLLERGRVYADTGDSLYKQRSLVIDTAAGSVTDVGTQFAVGIDGRDLDVAVREGRVDVAGDSATHVAVAGERVRIAADGEADYEALEAHDAYWDWATALAPDFDIENRSLLEFLRWASRETGRELVFADQELRMAAMRTDLGGSVAGFEPLEAVASVLTTTRFDYRIEADRIVILGRGD